MSLISFLKTILRSLNVSKKSEFVSIVVFLREPILFTEQTLRDIGSSALKRELQPEANEFVVSAGEGNRRLSYISLQNMLIHVHYFPTCYYQPANLKSLLAKEKDMRIQKVLQEHTAWLSFDLCNGHKSDKKLFYQRFCSVIATMFLDNCLGVLPTEKAGICPCDGNFREALLSGDPVRALQQWDRVPIAEDGNVKLEDAMDEARNRWPQFQAAFLKRTSEQTFLVKAIFRDIPGESGEWMWILVDAMDDGFIQGKLSNDPVNVATVKNGDQVRIPVTEIGDWIYKDGRKFIGGFTEKVMRG